MSTILSRPVIGLFLDRHVVDKLKNQQGNYKLIKHAEAADTAGVTLVVFSIDDIFFGPDRLRGVNFNRRRRRWETINCTGLDVLYDRFVGSGGAQVKQANYIRQQLSARGVKRINARYYFDKWQIYRILSRCGGLSSHLPYTRCLHGPADLKEMFAVSDTLYCKKTTGRIGREVIKINRVSPGRFKYSYFRNRLYTGQANSLPGLFNIIRSVAGSGRIIVQQAVDLLKINNRIIDLRGELQRNGKGKLEIVAVLARLGKENSPIATHGSSFMWEGFFRGRLRYSPREMKALQNKIENLLTAVYGCLERAYGLFGEIAVDFGLDNRGRLWIFECNTKSRRVSLLKAADSKTVNRAFLNPMVYAKYLYMRGR